MFAAIRFAARIAAVPLIFLAALFATATASAQAYPSKPIKLIVFTNSGSRDDIIRIVRRHTGADGCSRYCSATTR